MRSSVKRPRVSRAAWCRWRSLHSASCWLAGFEPLRTGVSLLAGTAYSLLLFAMIGRSAARAVLFPPAQGTRIVRRGYFFRYLLTGAAVFAAIRLPQLQPLAAILPLFFPKLILLWQQVRPSVRKGGEENGI